MYIYFFIRKYYLVKKIINILTISLLITSISAKATADSKNEYVEFNTSLINSAYAKHTDFSQFNENNNMQVGEFTTDIWLNDSYVTTQSLTFNKAPDGTVVICMKSGLLPYLNIVPAAIHNIDKLSNDKCIPIKQIIPSANLIWDNGKQKLIIEVPQRDLEKKARGSVPSSMWQNGSQAAFVGYNTSFYQASSGDNKFNSKYLGLNSGLNIGDLYFRHNGNLTDQTGSKTHYQNINTYVQSDITPIHAKLLVGQSNTSGRLFDSLSYTGISISSDERMLPESQRGYAPEIRGIATSNARVSVKQNGIIIYETNVPPGAFLINDLYPTGYGGDLTVSVRESDGSENITYIPYSSIAELIRPGTSRYEIVVGKYRRKNEQDGQSLYQISWQQGLTNSLSLYGGSQLSDNYRSIQAGSAFSLPIGAIAFDVTQATTTTVKNKLTGQSYRIAYNKLLSSTKSNIAIAAYRFSTSDYLGFGQAIEYQNIQKSNSLDNILQYRTKNRYSLTISQELPENWGTLAISGFSQNYWAQSGVDMQYQLGYSNSWNNISYALTAIRNKTQYGTTDNSWQLSLNLPLGKRVPMTLSSSIIHDNSFGFVEQISLSGVAGERQQFSWGTSGTHNPKMGSTGTFNGQYLSSSATINSSLGFGKDSRTINGGISGAIVAHPYGITFTPYISDTWVVINAPGATGAEVINYPGLSLDNKGNAVMPAYMPYQYNTVSLDPKSMNQKIELDSTLQNVVPRSGAVVVAKFSTQEGYALMLIPEKNNQGLPFGTTVTDTNNNQAAIVGQGGMTYLRVKEKKGQLLANIRKNKKNVTCIIPFDVIDESKTIQRIIYSC